METKEQAVKYAKILNSINILWVIANFILSWIFRTTTMSLIYIGGSAILAILSTSVFITLEKDKTPGRYWFIAAPVVTFVLSLVGIILGIISILAGIKFTEAQDKLKKSQELPSENNENQELNDI